MLITSLTASPFTCSPPLSVGSIGLDESVKSRSTYVAARMVHRLFLVLARKPKRTRLLPTVLDLRPVYPLSNRKQPPLLSCPALEELSGRWPATSVPENGRGHRFMIRTWSSLTTLRGLVRRNWIKKRECSTGTTSNHRTQLLSVRKERRPYLFRR